MSATVTHVFITATNKLEPDDKHARKRIRKQAMSKSAQARRKRGGYGQHNLIQYPAEFLPCSDGRSDPKVSVKALIPASLASSSYEKMRMRYNFDLLDLSQLTSFHISYATANILAHKPTMLTEVLGHRDWSYLNYLPGRIGHNSALDKAAACVAARAQQWLSSPSEPVSNSILKLYSSALAALQAELQCPNACLRPDVLCATQLLGIYELLKMSTEDAWRYHSTGATALIKLRGPGRCETDFEKALVLSHVGQIFHEALNINQTCFLSDGPWQAALRSIPTTDNLFSDRSEPIISLLTTVCRVPEYFYKTTQIICVTRHDTPASLVDDVQNNLQLLRLQLLHWYEIFFGSTTSDYPKVDIDKDRKHEALGFSFAVSIILNRLLFCLDPVENAHCEETAQNSALKILMIAKQELSAVSQAELFMAIKFKVAKVTLATAERWRDWYMNAYAQSNPLTKPLIMPKDIFADWCQRMGWETPRQS
ncbi:hypothetical protein THARTR1_00614 [Trichoderma harzianum]|uniref:C6 zinc finger domain-containing protein n=1 Tax=Trichoderma harzianum TaxID=5544 RepID=A0A2K0UPN2_TRIHA|nr:hypothetical protein THARTR1_00614 [Trichoderma harzianum]